VVGDLMAGGVFGRDNELAALRQRLAKRRSFLLHGPSGIGKTILLREVLGEHPEALYCPDSSGKQMALRALANALLKRSDGARRALKSSEGIGAKSAIALKGIVLELLRAGKYWIVLDHLKLPSQAFAADVKEMAGWGGTPVLGVARSDHMEDAGFLLPLFSDRSEKLELKPLDEALAAELVHKVIEDSGLSAQNLPEFIARVLELARGNPGAISSMVRMASLPKYRLGTQIMVAPLYVDFRLNGQPAGMR
jgi:DNA polymerase III delta prime subunit